jgi:hypothetical protein
VVNHLIDTFEGISKGSLICHHVYRVWSRCNALDNQKTKSSLLYGRKLEEIYQNAAGLGKAGNSMGGFTFQFSDGWWK